MAEATAPTISGAAVLSLGAIVVTMVMRRTPLYPRSLNPRPLRVNVILPTNVAPMLRLKFYWGDCTDADNLQ
jgi:hypothetical protein